MLRHHSFVLISGDAALFRTLLSVVLVCFFLSTRTSTAEDILIEAESFEDPGGWVLDTQFINTMGSPYLLAHGLGKPVKNAKTRFTAPVDGTYRVHVRTLNWIAKFNADGAPGIFQVLVDGKPLNASFGNIGKT